MGRYSLKRFIEVGALLSREIGEETGQQLFKRFIKGLGEGNRVSVPRSCLDGRNPGLFEDVLELFCRMLGDSTGIVMFRRVIVELGQGEYLTVPFLNCDDGRETMDDGRWTMDERRGCRGCTRTCFTRLGRNEMIRNRFKGFNHREIALEFGLSCRQVRRIVHGK